MDLQLLRRMLRGKCHTTLISSHQAPPRRHESTYRRTKKKLNIKPHSSFLPSFDTNGAPQQDHIIFNPPSSTPSAHHTPLKFLPKDDIRRNLLASSSPSLSSTSTSTRLPPILDPKKSDKKLYHMTEADAAEIRRLRTLNPVRWSRLKLAKKYNCSPLFVAMCCEAPPEKKALEKAKFDAVKANWGAKTAKAAEERARRKALWYRDG